MVIVSVGVGTDHHHSFYMDGYLLKNLKYAKDSVLNKKNMFVCLIDGRTGTGKSTLGCQAASYLTDGKHSVLNTTFTTKQFTDRLKEIKRGQAIVIDEAFLLLNKRKTQSSQNMIILSIMQAARVKQCFIFIILPSMFDLDKNLTLNIGDLFLHCYRKGSFGSRGQFSCYDRIGLKRLWLFCRQEYSYRTKISMPNFRASFTKKFPIDQEAYDKKKDEALASMAKVDGEADNKYLQQRNDLIYALKEEGKSVEEICKIVKLTPKAVYNVINKPKVEA